ncbi:hypothetical protein B7486_14545 [cyanobacterium TDX16]|nr:hypothetical protein B7486_14545 [cyanobacterium TDX16]
MTFIQAQKLQAKVTRLKGEEKSGDSARLEQVGVKSLEAGEVALVIGEDSGDEGVGLAVAGGASLLVQLHQISDAGDDLGHEERKLEVMDAADACRVGRRNGGAAEADDGLNQFALMTLAVLAHTADFGAVLGGGPGDEGVGLSESLDEIAVLGGEEAIECLGGSFHGKRQKIKKSKKKAKSQNARHWRVTVRWLLPRRLRALVRSS